MVTVTLAEKPDACFRIAKALAEKKLKKKTSEFGVNYYEFYRHGKKHIAVAAVGHLFNLKQAKGKWTYPIFDVKWVPSFKARKSSAFSEKYFKTIEAIAKKGSEYIVACDLDTEGSTLAWNIIRFIFNQKDAKRMKFSTLTKADLIKAYEEMSDHLDWENIEAGLARHHLDFIYGINVSRALTLAIKKMSPRFAVLSAGRVQGPTLSILAEKELKIKKFVPKPYWQLQLILLINGNTVIASYEKEKLWDEKEAKKIFESCKGRPAIVDDVKKKKYKQKPPVPFNVTSLQTEAYRLFGYSPQQTLRIAQNLYTNAYISYPRTSSEKLPPQIGYREILEALSKIKKYKKLCKGLLSLSELKPVEGKRCVVGDTLIPLLNGEIVTIEELVRNKRKNKIISLNEEYKTTHSEIKDRLSFENDSGRIFDIVLQTNDKISVTNNHPLLALIDGTPKWKLAEEIKEGMLLAVPRQLEVFRQKEPSNILEIFDLFNENEQKKILLYFKKEIKTIIKNKKSINSLIIELNKKLNINLNTIKSYFQRCCIPYLIIKYLVKKRILNIKDLENNIISYSWSGAGGNKKVFLPFYMNSEFLYFIGLIAADGHNTGKEIEVVNIKKLSKIFHDTASMFKLEVKDYKGHLSIVSKLLCEILDKLCVYKGKKSHKIEVSNFILKQPNDILPAFIAGFFDGDGSIYKTKDTVNISIASKSEIFLRKLKLLLLTFSIHFRFHSNDIRIYHEDIKKFYKIIHKFTKIKKEKLEILCKNIKITKTSRLIYIPSDIVKNKIYEKNLKLKDIEKKIGRIRYSLNKNYRNCYYFTINKLRKLAYLLNDKYLISLANADVFWLPVKKIIKREFNFKVYDLTVSNRNFIANGIVSHNSDPAHEAIHPTIEPPKNINKLRGPEKKIYDLICRRYFTHFASEAVRESMKVTILVNKHKFFTTGRRTIEKGWMEFYGPYAKFDEIILPDLRKGDELNVKKLEMLSKETTPPPRYSQASIIKLLEQKNLGTRATRAAILQTLYDRNYVMGKSIKVTPLGLKLASTLKKYVPDFVDEKLTRKFEKELEKIMEGKAKKEKILKEARKALIKICDEFKQHEKKIGRELGKAIVETQEDRSIVGPCPNCGRDLKRLFSPRTRKFFVGCTGYKDGCRTGYPLPHNSSIQRLDKICEKCNTPIIRVIRKGKRPFKMCLDPNCKSKENWGKPKKDKSG